MSNSPFSIRDHVGVVVGVVLLGIVFGLALEKMESQDPAVPHASFTSASKPGMFSHSAVMSNLVYGNVYR